MSEEGIKKTIVVGLDGATFDLIGPWMNEGKLPWLAKMRNEGAAGHLRTVIPPITPAAWTSFLTGTNPGKHGIYDFLYRRENSYELAPNIGGRRRGKPIWTILAEYGYRSGIVNVPMTYPPESLEGFMVTGFETPRSAPAHKLNYTWPTELREEIHRTFGDYRILPRGSYREGKIEQRLEELHGVLDERVKVLDHLMTNRPWDFFLFVISETDIILHDLWHLIDPRHPHHNGAQAERFGDCILHFYQAVDRQVGELVERHRGDGTVVVMSDHGNGPLYKFIYLNNWLMEKGYLNIRRDPISRFKHAAFRLGWTPENAFKTARRLGFSKARLGQGTRHRIINRLFLGNENIDWGRTRAYAVGHFGQIFLNLKGREPEGVVAPGEEARRLAEEIREELKAFKDGENGENVVDEVYLQDEVYHGERAYLGADIVFQPTRFEYSSIGVSSFIANKILGTVFGTTGNHRMNGIIIFNGSDYKAGERLEGATIVDILPTLLHQLGMEIEPAVDGQVLQSAFADGFTPPEANRQTPMGEGPSPSGDDLSEKEKEALEEQLRNLGYLS